MEISDEMAAQPNGQDLLDSEIRSVFQDTLGLIHIALVSHYGLDELEAKELEKDLYVWFVRFCMRPGAGSPRDLRPFLLVACCQFAREYQKYMVGSGVRETDLKLQNLLNRDPGDVAGDFARSLELLSFRRPDF